MELLLLKEGSPEMEWLWEWLTNHPINESVLDDPTTALNRGEAWQYLGSFRHKGEILHELRHRCHPLTNTLIELKVSASPAFTEDQILPKNNKNLFA